MDKWKYYEITHRDHVLCNPLSTAKLEHLIRILRLKQGARVLDIGTGKGEFLIRLAERYRVWGIGIDIAANWVAEAKEKAAYRVSDGDVTFIAMPGGLGTMDEIFETTTLIQTGKVADFPVVMMGSDFWAPLLDFMRNTMLREGTIDDSDIDRIKVTDDPEEAAACILQTVVKRFGLHWEATGGPRREREV